MAVRTIIPDLGVDVRLLRLLQLVSPTLPVGAFAYSQGLEWAVEAAWVGNSSQALQWISGVLLNSQVRLDLPVLARLYQARREDNAKIFDYWNRFLLAARGSAELQQEDCLMGKALQRLFGDLAPQSRPCPCDAPCFTAMFALAASDWHIDLESACAGLLWSIAENQVAAAIKLVPLGQTHGQRILMQVADVIPGAVKTALEIDDEDIGAVAPAQTIASMRHETQHTRLFRS